MSTPITISAASVGQISNPPAESGSIQFGANATAASSIPYLNFSVALANEVHTYLLNKTSDVYFFSASSNWTTITSTQYSTLGNAFIVAGLLQLYQATENQTYLIWASGTSEQFWDHGWQGAGGFYDTYNSDWTQSSGCEEILQDNALFELDFLELHELNGSLLWMQRANAEEELLNAKFWDSSESIAEVGYVPCTGLQSGDVDIETSVGSYLWATGEWTAISGNQSYMNRMNEVASFAEKYLWDGASNTLQGGPGSTDCGGPSGSLGFMRSVYANLTGLEDCRKGANENAWGAIGLAELYSLTGNKTILSWTDRDLTWINDTLWDPTYGGYHNDVFRNDTLRSSCSSIDDAEDYPGWTQGEQPMLFWNIGQLTGNTTLMRWSLTAETWTVQHQWNYTDGNGGEMTCLNNGAIPDKGSPYLYDWVQASGIYSFSTIGSLEASGSTSSTTTTKTASTSSGPTPSSTLGTTSSSSAAGPPANTSSSTSAASRTALLWASVLYVAAVGAVIGSVGLVARITNKRRDRQRPNRSSALAFRGHLKFRY